MIWAWVAVVVDILLAIAMGIALLMFVATKQCGWAVVCAGLLVGMGFALRHDLQFIRR